MKYKKPSHRKIYMDENQCINCECRIDWNVRKFSMDNIGLPLCRDCQGWLDNLDDTVTDYQLNLYFALKARKVKVLLEKWDGYKHIDIAIPSVKLNLEIDGKHHNTDPVQALSDLQRTYYPYLKGYFTLRIPNSLVCNDEMMKKRRIT